MICSSPLVPQPPRQLGGCWVSFVGCCFFWEPVFFSLFFSSLVGRGTRGCEKGTGGQDLGIDLGFGGAAAHFFASLFFFLFSFFVWSFFLLFSFLLFSSSAPFVSRYTHTYRLGSTLSFFLRSGRVGWERRTAGSWDRGNGGILGLLCFALLCLLCFSWLLYTVHSMMMMDYE